MIELGVEKKDVVMVHASMRKVARDPKDVVAALLETAGTVMAYVDWEMSNVFDPRTSRAARDNGILAETIRAWPGAIRSAHPDAGMSAIGERAAWLTADHPFRYGYGEGSPLAKLDAIGGKVLLLGAPLDTITLLHFSEHVANIPNKRVIHYTRKFSDGRVAQFEEFGKAHVGKFGDATAHLFDAAELHAFGVAWMERHGR
ncbi:MAG TPA: AAC(3) family N-acetyltransferase [Polyangiaceae bacterium]|nr:AAC(3) family N-acetyltransferase [Polyangiaceae bacterium]